MERKRKKNRTLIVLNQLTYLDLKKCSGQERKRWELNWEISGIPGAVVFKLGEAYSQGPRRRSKGLQYRWYQRNQFLDAHFQVSSSLKLVSLRCCCVWTVLLSSFLFHKCPFPIFYRRKMWPILSSYYL